MTRQQAIAFLQLIGQCQPFVPPVLFVQLAQTEAIKAIAGVADGASTCEIRAVEEGASAVGH